MLWNRLLEILRSKKFIELLRSKSEARRRKGRICRSVALELEVLEARVMPVVGGVAVAPGTL